jgi:phosphate transport system substrate-binding protein
VLVDGSSTVLPISEAILALYASRLVTDITIASSGTSGGFQKFCQAEIAIAGASRPITAAEMKFCQSNGVQCIELPVAFDGIAVVVDKNNEHVKALSVKELQRLWEPKAEGSLVQCSDLRAGLPKQRFQLAGPGLQSGTFDFFARAVVGSEHASRSDYKASEDDRELVDFVASTPGALGYFGLAYYAKNRDRLQAVAIDDGVAENGDGAIEPSPETVANGTYHRLSRPVSSMSMPAMPDATRCGIVSSSTCAPQGSLLPMSAMSRFRSRYSSWHRTASRKEKPGLFSTAMPSWA